jgi:hypothetical protein
MSVSPPPAELVRSSNVCINAWIIMPGDDAGSDGVALTPKDGVRCQIVITSRRGGPGEIATGLAVDLNVDQLRALYAGLAAIGKQMASAGTK